MNTAKNDITLHCGGDLGVNLQTCVEIIAEGGALVNVETTATELSKAPFVAIKRDGDQIVGVGAIKQQRPWYARDKSTKSGFDFDENPHELGYISVRHTHRNRGIAREIKAAFCRLISCIPWSLLLDSSH